MDLIILLLHLVEFALLVHCPDLSSGGADSEPPLHRIYHQQEGLSHHKPKAFIGLVKHPRLPQGSLSPGLGELPDLTWQVQDHTTHLPPQARAVRLADGS